jgi:hypothetical protein
MKWLNTTHPRVHIAHFESFNELPQAASDQFLITLLNLGLRYIAEHYVPPENGQPQSAEQLRSAIMTRFLASRVEDPTARQQQHCDHAFATKGYPQQLGGDDDDISSRSRSQ